MQTELTDILRIRLAGGQTLERTLRATSVQAAQLELTYEATGLPFVSPVVFGSAALDTEVRVTNVGDEVATLDPLSLVGDPEFTLLTPPASTILPGEYTTFTIRFAGGAVCYNDLATTWETKVLAAGGTYLASDREMACQLARTLIGKVYYPKIALFMPMLGQDLAASMIPLISTIADVLGGAAGSLTFYNNGFTNADFLPFSGLTGKNGAYFEISNPTTSNFAILFGGITPSAPSGSSQIHCWLKNIPASGSVFPWGYYGGGGTGFFSQLNSTGLPNVPNWDLISGPGSSGDAQTRTSAPTAPLTNGWYTWDCSRDTISGFVNRRRLYKDGALLVTTTNQSGANTGSAGENAYLMAANNQNSGLLGATGLTLSCFAITSCLMTDAEQLDFYQTVRDHLIIPLGRN